MRRWEHLGIHGRGIWDEIELELVLGLTFIGVLRLREFRHLSLLLFTSVIQLGFRGFIFHPAVSSFTSPDFLYVECYFGFAH